MTYLYGDSTPSLLESNFIQFLSDALDTSVHVLLSSERIKGHREQVARLQAGANAEISRLARLGEMVGEAIGGASKGDVTSPTSICAVAIGASVAELVRKQVAEVQSALATSIAAVEAQDAVERQECLKSLGGLLVAHDPPGATTTFHLVQQDGGRYLCRRSASTPYGLSWVLDVDIPAPHPFSQVLRVDKLVPQLEVSAPEVGGWLRKEVRNRAHRLEKLYLAEMTFVPEGATLRLRTSLDEGATGFDVEIDSESSQIKLQRVGEPGDLIEPSEADAEKLLALHAKLRGLALEIPQAQGQLEEAKLDDRPLVELDSLTVVIDRLVAAMAPIVSQIAQHSQAPTELVLKRLLGDNRREEIFVSKATLSEKLNGLPEPLRASFGPLGLSPSASRPPPVPSVAPPMRQSAADV